MVELVMVSNYQSLKEITLELGKFTVIVGESGCGKSAFIRAEQNMVTNQPVCGGDWTHLPPNAPNCKVFMVVDGRPVLWVKGAKDNMYTMDTIPLKKVGKGCPEDIQEILKMPELSFDDKSKYYLNFQEQFDLPFLLGDTGSKVASLIGEITNINILYAANKEALRQKLSVSRTLSVRDKDLTKLREEFLSYGDLDYLAEKKKHLTWFRVSLLKTRETLEVFKQCKNNLDIFISNTNILQDRKLKLNNIPTLVNALVDIENIFTSYNTLSTFKAAVDRYPLLELQNKYNSLKVLNHVSLPDDLLSQYQDLNKHFKSLEQIGKNINILNNQVDKLKKIPDTLPDDKDLSTLETLLRYKTELEATRAQALYLETKVKSSKDNLDTFISDYTDFIQNNPLCPVCQKPLDKEVF